MNQIAIGRYIFKKRKEANLTQEQLAEKLCVSNKTISKWENGKCMPDYSVINVLCEELSITVSELINGEDNTNDTNNDKTLELIKDVQNLKTHNQSTESTLYLLLSVLLTTMANSLGDTLADKILSTVLSITAVSTAIINLIKSFQKI